MKGSRFLALSVTALLAGCQAVAAQQGDSIDLEVRAETGSLVECDSSAKISWSGAGLPLNSSEVSSDVYFVTVYASVSRPEIPDSSDLVSKEIYTSPINTTELDLNVTWAAGTFLFLYVEADVVFGKNSDAERQQSWRGNVTYTVQSGSSQACIIPAHKPVVLDFRPLLNLSQCETVAVSWSGGIPPYAVTAMITNDATTAALRTSGSLEYNMFPLVVGTTATSLEWTVDYAAGVEVAFLVDSASSGSTVSRRFTVGAGSTACTIPDENQFKASSALSRVAQYSPWSMLALLATPFMLSM